MDVRRTSAAAQQQPRVAHTCLYTFAVGSIRYMGYDEREGKDGALGTEGGREDERDGGCGRGRPRPAGCSRGATLAMLEGAAPGRWRKAHPARGKKH